MPCCKTGHHCGLTIKRGIGLSSFRRTTTTTPGWQGSPDKVVGARCSVLNCMQELRRHDVVSPFLFWLRSVTESSIVLSPNFARTVVSDNRSDPSQEDKLQEHPQPRCENCDIPMTFLGIIRRFLDKPSIKVYRCYECNVIHTEET
jgi:hypothetical protein